MTAALTVFCDPGVLPGKWVARWRERYPQHALRVRPLQGVEKVDILLMDAVRPEISAGAGADADAGLAPTTNVSELGDAELLAEPPSNTPITWGGIGERIALLRLPLDRSAAGALHAIPLYSETTHLVMPKDCLLDALDEITLDDLVEACSGDDAYALLQMPQHLVGWNVLHETLFAEGVEPAVLQPDTFADAVEAVANEAGLLLLPHSIARLNDRKDVVHREIVGVPESRVAVAWRVDSEAWQVEEFVGIVRGRTANSSRQSEPAAEEQSAQSRAKAKAKAAARAEQSARAAQGADKKKKLEQRTTTRQSASGKKLQVGKKVRTASKLTPGGKFRKNAGRKRP